MGPGESQFNCLPLASDPAVHSEHFLLYEIELKFYTFYYMKSGQLPAGGWPGARAGWLAARVHPVSLRFMHDACMI
eukprot:COSAG05_NODE_99_length_19400_cov_50.107559_6_plen_76_part_00